jgi:hypothetical protein
MALIIILLFIVAIGPLAVRHGVDSRRTSDRRSI